MLRKLIFKVLGCIFLAVDRWYSVSQHNSRINPTLLSFKLLPYKGEMKLKPETFTISKF